IPRDLRVVGRDLPHHVAVRVVAVDAESSGFLAHLSLVVLEAAAPGIGGPSGHFRCEVVLVRRRVADAGNADGGGNRTAGNRHPVGHSRPPRAWWRCLVLPVVSRARARQPRLTAGRRRQRVAGISRSNRKARRFDDTTLAALYTKQNAYVSRIKDVT